MTQEKAENIERETRGQGSNPRWKDERQFRITASRFGDIIKRTDADGDLGTLAHDIFYPPDLSKVPAIVHGRIYEQTAIEAFMAKTGKEVTACGIFIDPRCDCLPFADFGSFRTF